MHGRNQRAEQLLNEQRYKRQVLGEALHIAIKELERFDKVGDRITGDRTQCLHKSQRASQDIGCQSRMFRLPASGPNLLALHGSIG